MTEELTMTVISNILNSGTVSAILFAGLVVVWRDNRQLVSKIDAKDLIILNLSGRVSNLEGKHEAYQTVVDKFSRVEEALEIALIKQNNKA